MSRVAFKTQQRDDREIHFSVGALIRRDSHLLLIDRAKPPLGLAGVAGHIDVDEETLAALKREVAEETGMIVEAANLLGEGFIEWNWCNSGVTGHYWYVYDCQVSGEVEISQAEVKSFGWHDPTKLTQDQLEPVWYYWLNKLGIINK